MLHAIRSGQEKLLTFAYNNIMIMIIDIIIISCHEASSSFPDPSLPERGNETILLREAFA